MEEWFEGHLGLTADELGIVLVFVLPLLALLTRHVRGALRRVVERLALAFGLPQARYRQWFLAEHGVLRNIYLNRVETIDLGDSYISLSVQAEAGGGASRLPATTLMAPSGPRRMVIVGDPGAGKSTLLKAYGSGVLCRTAGDSELNVVGRTNELPVLVTLRQVADFFVRGGRLDEHVVDLMAKGTRSGNARRMLRSLLLQGRVVLMLDGLDEVSRTAYDAVRAAIHAFVTADEDAELPTSMARVVITCRQQSYRQIREDWEGWFAPTSYTIAALRDAEIKRFVMRRAGQFSNQRPAAAFLADVRASGTVDLHRIPLILTISLGLYTQLAAYEIPHSVGAFYDEMIRELLRRHDFRAEGQLRMNRYRAEDKYRFLCQFALHLAQMRRSPFADFAYADLLAFCVAQRRTMPRLRDHREFVDEIIDRSGLLARTTNDSQFAFAHRALHEYLAAAELAHDPQQGSRFLLSRAADPEWRQVAVLFCGENPPYLEYFLRGLADLAPDAACQCLATADVSTDVAGELIDRARRRSMLSPIMEAVKSPVAETRSLALDALRTELIWIARSTVPLVQRRIFSALFGGQFPVVGKVLLSMSEHATPEMASAIVELASAMPADEPALVAPLWHCLAIPGIERTPVARRVIGRLLELAMDRECARTLQNLPAVRVEWSTAADREAAYPLKGGLSPTSNLVMLLGFGHRLNAFDQVTCKNQYLKALGEPSQPLRRLEASTFLSRLSLYRVAQVLAYGAFYSAVLGILTMIVLGAQGRIEFHVGANLVALCVSLAAATVIMIVLSRLAVRKYCDHLYAADFSRWSYLMPAVDGAFGPSQVESLWNMIVRRPRWLSGAAYIVAWSEDVLAVLGRHLLVTALYGLPFAIALWRRPSVIPVVVIPLILIYYWIPSTEFCGPYTIEAIFAPQRAPNVYQDPASRHWVLASDLSSVGSDGYAFHWPARPVSASEGPVTDL